MTGRPSSYTDELADTICDRLAEGESLRRICSDEGMPNKATVMRWLGLHEAFRDQYARAREMQAELLADEIIDIADDNSRDMREGEDGHENVNHDVIQRAKLRIDSRKWVAAKLLPKKYGDKLALGGDPDAPPIKTESTVRIYLPDNGRT